MRVTPIHLTAKGQATLGVKGGGFPWRTLLLCALLQNVPYTDRLQGSNLISPTLPPTPGSDLWSNPRFSELLQRCRRAWGVGRALRFAVSESLNIQMLPVGPGAPEPKTRRWCFLCGTALLPRLRPTGRPWSLKNRQSRLIQVPKAKSPQISNSSPRNASATPEGFQTGATTSTTLPGFGGRCQRHEKRPTTLRKMRERNSFPLLGDGG